MAGALVDRLTSLIQDFTQDWDEDFDNAIGAQTRLLADLGFESIDIIQFIVAIEEDFGVRKIPFEQLLMQDGRYVDDLSLGQIASFLAPHLAAAAQAAKAEAQG